MRPTIRLRSFTLVFLALACTAAFAQTSQGYLNDLGNTPYGINIPVENGFINISNGNLHLEFPIAGPPQRGALSLSERLVYDSRIWMFLPFGSHGSYHWWPKNVTAAGGTDSSGGWRFVKGNETGGISYNEVYFSQNTCNPDDNSQSTNYTDQIIWTDPSGTAHPLNAAMNYSNDQCLNSSSQSISPGTATDGSGYSAIDDGNGNPLVFDNSGNQVYPQVIDRYGNYFSGYGDLIDDTGRVPVITTQNGNVTYYDVLAPNGPINNNGTRVRYTVTTAPVSVATNFQQSDVYEWNPSNPTLNPVQSIQLPDGSQYSFTYDGYGGLSSMTLPTGGVIQYGYGNFVDSSNTANRWLTSRTVGSDPAMTFTPSIVTGCANYGTGCVEQVKLHQPSGDETVYQLTLVNGAWNTGVTAYTGSANGGQQLSNVATVDTYANGCSLGGSCAGQTYVSQSTSTKTLYGSQPVSTQTQTFYNPTVGKISASKSWDFGTNFSGTPTLETDYSYTGLDVQQVTVLSNGNQASQTNYTYTATATATSNIAQHGTANAGGPYLQKVSQWINTGGTLDQTMTYDDTGTLLSSTDPNGTTQYGHDPTEAFVTSTTPPTPSSGVTLTTSATFDPNSGVPLTQTDANGTKTLFLNYDAMNRPTEVDTRDSGGNVVAKSTYSYPNPTSSGVQQYQNASIYGDVETQYDAFGRLSRTAVYNGQSGNPWYQQDTCYDSNGRVNFQSLPYQGTGWGTAKVCSNTGTATLYDGLGRATAVSNADGTARTTYAGRAVQTVDVNNVTKVSQTDAFGRPTIVCEVSANNTMPGTDPPGSCGTDISATGFVTSYTYDPANHKTTVAQGPQTRTFQTDSVGRSSSTLEPERGATSYTYAYNATGLVVTRTRPQANQTNPSVLTTTTTQSDALGRALTITYSDGTPTRTYLYDQANAWGINNNIPLGSSKGRLTRQMVNAGNGMGQVFGYDAMGRVVHMETCRASTCGHAADLSEYTYDWTGNLLTSTNPSGNPGTITYGRSVAGELTSMTSSVSNGTNLPGTILSNVVNGSNGPVSYYYGNGLSEAYSYDAMGRVQSGWLCQQAPSPGCSAHLHRWDKSQTGGQVYYASDDATGQNTTYTYDEFNRLKSANYTTNNGPQTFSYSYDRFGNRWNQNAPQGGPAPGFLFNTGNNQIEGMQYDAAGNQLSDGPQSYGFHTYQYDAEGNQTGVDNGQTAQYVYDAFNQRVWVHTSGNAAEQEPAYQEIDYDLNGKRLSIWDGSSGNLQKVQLYWGSKPVAFYTPGAIHFQHQDWLGSERVTTSYNGAVEFAMGHYPFGEVKSSQGNSIDAYQFGQLDHDDANTEHAQFREYSNGQGHWMSPDPYDGSMDLGNPQSLNRYSYVGNNPLLFTDPTGLDGGLTITVLAICGHVSGACAGGFTNPISAIVLGSIFAGAAIADFVAGFFAHPTMTQSQTPRPPDKACSAPKYAQARNFISANRDYAQKLASQLNTDAGNILGLSGNESGWGTGFLISAGTNNFFSLTSGKAFGGTIGTYQHGSYTYGTYPSPGFLTSGQSFADSYFGTRVNGISDPTNFAKALNANGSFNSESLATPYDKSIADTIKLTNKLMGCPAN